jgi:hypothetical protein
MVSNDDRYIGLYPIRNCDYPFNLGTFRIFQFQNSSGAEFGYYVATRIYIRFMGLYYSATGSMEIVRRDIGVYRYRNSAMFIA